MEIIYLIRDLALATGHSVYTIEYYLKEGLVEEIGRSPYTHYRFFDARSVDRLKQIRKWRKRGKPLKAIRTLLRV